MAPPAKPTFRDLLARRVLFLDGGMGTQVHARDLDTQKDFWGLENCTEVLVLSRPDVVEDIHAAYFAAGADAVETNTFGGMPHVLCEFEGLEPRSREICCKAAQIARKAADRFSTPENPRFVVGALGPGTKLVTLGNISYDEMHASYKVAAHGLIDGAVDAFLLETCQDILQIKCALAALFEAQKERGTDIPTWVQVTIEQTGTTLTGSSMEAALHALAPFPIVGLGMNCATGPEDMAEHIKVLSQQWDRAIAILPNAGLPLLVEGKTHFPLGPEPFAQTMAKFVEKYGLNIVGGCCGTTPAHIKALRAAVGERAPAQTKKTAWTPSSTSLYNATPHRQDASVLNVGERCNASGSRAFKKLLEQEAWDEIVSLAREQMQEGSHVLDVNVDYAGRDNARDMHEVVSRLVRQVDAPLMLDSTQLKTLEAGLKAAPGKCILNSTNFEDGEHKFDEACQLAKRFGAALVLGTIDEDPEEAMARTAERKFAIAKRAIERATTVHGLKVEDLFIDPLVLPISTGMDKDRKSGLELVEGLKRIHAAFPGVQSTVGLSNISFGLKPYARVVLNSVFQHELHKAGLTSAIVHASKILPESRIEPAQWQAALDLIYDRWKSEADAFTLPDGSTTRDPLQVFVALFPDGAEAQKEQKKSLADLPLEERLRKHIIDGEKRGLPETIAEALTKYTPLAIINDHLLDGMKTVGELFGSGKMQLPFVLQSAEVMKMSVAQLEPHMEKKDGATKGSMVLATVRGDVHDIGKNLVDIILTNNGYTVHNIGIKQPIEAILAKWEETKADAIGMSGLLVKSVNVMEENLGVMRDKGLKVPVLLGGAALAKNYCETHLRTVYGGKSVYHGQDAFEGLRLMDMLTGGKGGVLEAEIDQRNEERKTRDAKNAAMLARAGEAAPAPERSNTATDNPVPAAPFWGTRTAELTPEQVYPFINTNALFKFQWQFVRGERSTQEYDALLAAEAEPTFQRLKKELAHVLKPKVVYGYFPCYAQGQDLVVLDPETKKERERFHFPRQTMKPWLCIADYFKTKAQLKEGEYDTVAFQCVTMGRPVSEVAAELYKNNNYREYLFIHGMGVENAEALAEMWHKRVRQELGINQLEGAKIEQLFTGKYQGCRYSWGYPACPDMSEHEKVWRLLDPTRIGCELTESHQIDPEQSTCCIIVHHPEAKYFGVTEEK